MVWDKRLPGHVLCIPCLMYVAAAYATFTSASPLPRGYGGSQSHSDEVDSVVGRMNRIAVDVPVGARPSRVSTSRTRECRAPAHPLDSVKIPTPLVSGALTDLVSADLSISSSTMTISLF